MTQWLLSSHCFIHTFTEPLLFTSSSSSSFPIFIKLFCTPWHPHEWFVPWFIFLSHTLSHSHTHTHKLKHTQTHSHSHPLPPLTVSFASFLRTLLFSYPLLHSYYPNLHSSQPLLHSSHPLLHSYHPLLHSYHPLLHDTCSGYRWRLIKPDDERLQRCYRWHRRIPNRQGIAMYLLSSNKFRGSALHHATDSVDLKLTNVVSLIQIVFTLS